MLRNYIELEKMRSKNKFDFAIEYHDDLELDFIQIPPMLIQPFVENSIKHGFKNLDKKGLLKLNITDKTDRVEFIIEDIENLIDEYSPDCLIFCGNIHCKHKKSVPKIIKDTCKTSGVPTLNMSLDLFDPRVNSEETIKKQIKDFFINNGLA